MAVHSRTALVLTSLLLAISIIACGVVWAQAQRNTAGEVAAKSPPSGSARPKPLAKPSGEWSLELTSDKHARILFQNTEVARFLYLFWAKDWDWAPPQVTPGVVTGNTESFRLDIEKVNLHVDAKATVTAPNELTFTYVIKPGHKLGDSIGGGIEFGLDLLDRFGKPELSPDSRGFKWSTPEGELVVVFDAPVERLYFEKNNPSKVRCFFLVPGIAQSVTRKMTVRLPKGGRVRPSPELRASAGALPAERWLTDTLVWNDWPIDLRYLNAGDRPAGKRGRVIVQGDSLRFEDGTPARFWGANVVASALFNSSKEAVERDAARIAALGFNLISIHHHDSPWVNPNILGAQPGTLNQVTLEKLDWWIRCLTQEGIYVWLDLHVGRAFTAADAVPGVDELQRRGGQASGFNYVSPKIAQAMKKFADAYLTHRNQYTKLRYVDDPGVIGALITNENDITGHFGNLFLKPKNNPEHQKLFEALAKDFASKAKLPLPSALETWKPGPAKIVLNELAARFFIDATRGVRSAGFKGVLATTNAWGGPRAHDLPSLMLGDVIDVHSYGDPGFLETSPLLKPIFTDWVSSMQVAGKPLFISEWNVAFPAVDRFAAPLFVAALSNLQGWDAPMLYAYRHYAAVQPGKPEQWGASADPGLMATMPAAALLMRTGHVAPAKQTYRIELDREKTYMQDTSAPASAALRTLTEQSKLVIAPQEIPELSWDQTPKAAGGEIVVKDPARSFLAPGATEVVSDTGELRRNWTTGVHTIDTQKTQAAQGWIGGRSIRLTSVRFDVLTPLASVTVTSLDGKPISEAKRLLVTTVGRVVTSPNNTVPLRAEPVRGTISLPSKAPVSVYTLAPSARYEPTTGRGRPTTASAKLAVKEGAVTVNLPGTDRTHWYLLERE
jgi:hypothetical protein